MTKTKFKNKEELLQRQVILNSAKETLKKEFIGINQVIDQVIDSIRTWYLFPEIQDRPVIINLWGLTGVGKSSLVNRISDLIGFSGKHFSFDLGDKAPYHWGLKSQIEDIYEEQNGYPIILTLDEFQNARTIVDDIEVDQKANRVMWELLDSGKFPVNRSSFYRDDLYSLINQLKYLVDHKVVVKNGLVVGKKKYYLERTNQVIEYTEFNEKGEGEVSEEVMFVRPSFYADIFSLLKEYFKTTYDVEKALLQLDGQGTIDFLTDCFEKANAPVIVDCSKSLIFVCGNLDEAFTMCKDLNPDISCDEFHNESLKITVPNIKEALQDRFRNEQIARLGNTHIIYPAFSEQSFRELIDLRLTRINKKVQSINGIKLNFDDSLKNILYKEGVFPTQGTRPLFTTVEQVVGVLISEIIVEQILKEIKSSNVFLKYIDGYVIIEYRHYKRVVHSFSKKVYLNLDQLRVSKQDDVQAITAVHESGHAILSLMLLKTVPTHVMSSTASHGTLGFVYTKIKWDYVKKSDIINRLAMMLGGREAEKIVFGADYVTTGSESDLTAATKFVTHLLKSCSMGSRLGTYNADSPLTNQTLTDHNFILEEEIQETLNNAQKLASSTLKEQKKLLLILANHLSDKSSVTKEEILSYAALHGVDFNATDIVESGSNLYYRKQLKKMVQGGHTTGVEIVASHDSFSLNSDQNIR